VKNNKNPKKYVFNIFAYFLTFSASSQKNLNFQRSLERGRLLTCYILKSPIFLIRVDIDKKNPKKKEKSKFTKKRKKLRDQV
jgi:hypothetical protein